MRRQFAVFLVRWLLNSFGLWIAVRLLGEGAHGNHLSENAEMFLVAGFVFSLLNTILRPVMIILSLPVIVVTLGLFILVINGVMVWLVMEMVPGISMTFLSAIFAGMLLSLINYIVSSALELQLIKEKEDN